MWQCTKQMLLPIKHGAQHILTDDCKVQLEQNYQKTEVDVQHKDRKNSAQLSLCSAWFSWSVEIIV